MRVLVYALYRYLWSGVKPAAEINTEYATRFKDCWFKVTAT